ncbi:MULTISPECIES: hypothetical protein [unclassified Streptomyces]|uniref:hypothetical protein n=1 Tax=unclassified Streptomyces TaxID=2593676 RepID=UPI002030E679|nr:MULTISPECIES: hypothetical protein [unclassified Streptomyces]MCM1967152.1 hypothetical protein [Streptomyces sp. G1]MCX5127585.1 hypothetical protein [Streptomyces sp. NBC_00347]
MGARFYNPTTGCFLSTDPVHGDGDCRLHHLIGRLFDAGRRPIRQPHAVHNAARGRRDTTALRPALFIGAAEETMKVMVPLDGHTLDPAPAIP